MTLDTGSLCRECGSCREPSVHYLRTLSVVPSDNEADVVAARVAVGVPRIAASVSVIRTQSRRRPYAASDLQDVPGDTQADPSRPLVNFPVTLKRAGAVADPASVYFPRPVIKTEVRNGGFPP